MKKIRAMVVVLVLTMTVFVFSACSNNNDTEPKIIEETGIYVGLYEQLVLTHIEKVAVE